MLSTSIVSYIVTSIKYVFIMHSGQCLIYTFYLKLKGHIKILLAYYMTSSTVYCKFQEVYSIYI